VAAVLMVSALYSALLAERRRELGVLLALDGRRQLVKVVSPTRCSPPAWAASAVVILGAACCVLQRSLGYHLRVHGAVVRP